MADLNNKINDEALDEVSGGKLNTGLKHLPKSGGSGSMHTSGTTNWRPVRCSVQSGYLATSGAYVWARYNGTEGWVNSNYIIWL